MLLSKCFENQGERSSFHKNIGPEDENLIFFFTFRAAAAAIFFIFDGYFFEEKRRAKKFLRKMQAKKKRNYAYARNNKNWTLGEVRGLKAHNFI